MTGFFQPRKSHKTVITDKETGYFMVRKHTKVFKTLERSAGYCKNINT